MGNFADALRDLLNEQHISQRELARRLNLSAQAVNGWLNAGVTPTRENVVLIEEELAVEPRGFLLTAAGYASDGPVEPSVESLIRAHPRIDAEDKRVLVFLIQRAIERYEAAHPD